ncbi:acyl transferase/acyl hydrolase/lysophospholipase [Cladochytrium replicatum]|nr:acyl transferase/acyl hydrolase/lysophospholipase [Cladochytrium replicatum]
MKQAKTVKPNAFTSSSSTAFSDDLDNNTSTAEEFLSSEAEGERILLERSGRRRSPRSKSRGSNRSDSAPPASSRSRYTLTQLVFHVPLLLFVIACLLFDITLYTSIRIVVTLCEALADRFGGFGATIWRILTFPWGKRLPSEAERARVDMAASTNYDEYRRAALAMDEAFGLNAWKHEPDSFDFDSLLVQKTTRRLRRHRENADPAEVLRILRHGACKSNLGGMENQDLYAKTFMGSKVVVERFYDELERSLRFICDSNFMSPEKKEAFFRWASHNYGRTAICLSGGGTMGYFHFGIVKALFEVGLLPRVITGTSCGAMVAAMIACRTDEELKTEVFVPEMVDKLRALEDPWPARIRRLFKTGSLFSIEQFMSAGQWVTKGDTTFLEAYKRTGRVLNITVVAENSVGSSKVLNYLTAPDVLICSAMVASSAVPGLLPPVTLLCKNEKGELLPYRGDGNRWRDGSLVADIPERELKQLWNVNYTIVSQCNPHILPFFYKRRGITGIPDLAYFQGWRGGFLVSALIQYLFLDMQKLLHFLRDMHLAPRLFDVDLSDLFLQGFVGSATIVPDVNLRDVGKVLTDPRRREELVRYFEVGERASWPQVHRIENRMRIEGVVTECAKRCREQMRRKTWSAAEGGGRTALGRQKMEMEFLPRMTGVGRVAAGHDRMLDEEDDDELNEGDGKGVGAGGRKKSAKRMRKGMSSESISGKRSR